MTPLFTKKLLLIFLDFAEQKCKNLFSKSKPLLYDFFQACEYFNNFRWILSLFNFVST